jgi:glycosyltransferase involved in cell wall biosynthesis
VEQLAAGLATSDDCQVTFCASRYNRSQCNDYLSSVGSIFPLTESSQPWLAGIYDRIDPVDGTIGGSRCSVYQSSLLGLAYSLWLHYLSPVDQRTLAKTEIYHSPYDPLPRAVTSSGHRLRTFLTIYDLIPIKFPHFFPDFGARMMRERIASCNERTTYLCISEATRRDLCECFPQIDPARTVVIPLAAGVQFCPSEDPAEVDRVKARYGIPADDSYLLSVCTLEPRKNLRQTIASFASLVKQEHFRDLWLVLTGAEGWHEGEIAKAIDDSGVKERIITTGFVPDEELPALYNGAVAFVYPSLYEGFGLPPLEAMQCGTPVITSNTSSLPEVVGNGGIMVDPTDTDALSQAMLQVFADAILRKDLSNRALIQAGQFSWDRCVRETIAAYRAVLENSTP